MIIINKTFFLEILLKEKKKVLECFLIKIYKIIWETLKMINTTVKEKLYLITETLIKVNGKIIYNMA